MCLWGHKEAVILLVALGVMMAEPKDFSMLPMYSSTAETCLSDSKSLFAVEKKISHN